MALWLVSSGCICNNNELYFVASANEEPLRKLDRETKMSAKIFFAWSNSAASSRVCFVGSFLFASTATMCCVRLCSEGRLEQAFNRSKELRCDMVSSKARAVCIISYRSACAWHKVWIICLRREWLWNRFHLHLMAPACLTTKL